MRDLAPQPPQPKQNQESLEERVRRRAYELYQQRGGADGGDLDDWYQAEQEIRRETEEEGEAA